MYRNREQTITTNNTNVMKKFTIHIPHQEIHYLWNRLALSRWFGFSYKQWDKGIPTNYLSRIAV